MLITSEVMGQTKKAKITFTCSQEVKDFLDNWAKSERRTLSNLVEGLVEQLIVVKKQPHIEQSEDKENK